VKHYLRDDIVRFLEAIDAALPHEVQVIVIGGAAAAVHYRIERGTDDIDTWTNVDGDLATAIQRARDATGIDLPFERSGVADAPYDFESRLERALPNLTRLEVFVPERHDLVLMKTIRGDEADLLVAAALHQSRPLELDTLVQRYVHEMGSVVIEPTRLRGNFLALIDRLFPRDVETVRRRLPSGRRER
jgi:hypothetical protein